MRVGAPALALGALLLLWPRPAAQASAETYYDLVYDFEVAWICGLASQPLYDSYMDQRRAIEDAGAQDAEALTEIRIQAMAAAEREFDNRGLGGHRQWCESDGQAGVERISEPPTEQ